MEGERRTLVGCLLGVWIRETAGREMNGLSSMENSGAGLGSKAQGRGFKLYLDRWTEGGERGEWGINMSAHSQTCA